VDADLTAHEPVSSLHRLGVPGGLRSRERTFESCWGAPLVTSAERVLTCGNENYTDVILGHGASPVATVGQLSRSLRPPVMASPGAGSGPSG
jgi:hypothetical protein